MILLIDNYDSFSYNLYQLIGSVNPDIQVVRNDEITLADIEKMKPEAIVLSPGPGKPADAGICIPVIKEFAGKISGSKISFSVSKRRNTSTRVNNNSEVRGRGNHGSGT